METTLLKKTTVSRKAAAKPAAKAAPKKKTPAKAAPKKTKPAVKKVAEPNFKTLYEVASKTVIDNDKTLRDLKDAISKLTVQLEEDRRNRNFYRKLINMKNWINKPYMWHLRKHEGSQYSKTAWREYAEYKMAKLEFSVSIKERTDLKKFKWEVEIKGTSLMLSGSQYEYNYKEGDNIGNDYSDYNYLTKCKKYEGVEFTQKFDTEGNARAWMKEWMVKLVEDHKAIIAEEQRLMKQIKVIKER